MGKRAYAGVPLYPAHCSASCAEAPFNLLYNVGQAVHLGIAHARAQAAAVLSSLSVGWDGQLTPYLSLGAARRACREELMPREAR